MYKARKFAANFDGLPDNVKELYEKAPLILAVCVLEHVATCSLASRAEFWLPRSRAPSPQALAVKDGTSRDQCSQIINMSYKRDSSGKLVENTDDPWFEEAIKKQDKKFKRQEEAPPLCSTP